MLPTVLSPDRSSIREAWEGGRSMAVGEVAPGRLPHPGSAPFHPSQLTGPDTAGSGEAGFRLGKASPAPHSCLQWRHALRLIRTRGLGVPAVLPVSGGVLEPLRQCSVPPSSPRLGRCMFMSEAEERLFAL